MLKLWLYENDMYIFFFPKQSFQFWGDEAFCDQLIRSNISAKLDSGDAASLVRGFRQVLRGVCEGDLVLDGRGWSIVDDASCLERLLKSYLASKLQTIMFYDCI